jgi:hypothetical protein
VKCGFFFILVSKKWSVVQKCETCSKFYCLLHFKIKIQNGSDFKVTTKFFFLILSLPIDLWRKINFVIAKCNFAILVQFKLDYYCCLLFYWYWKIVEKFDFKLVHLKIQKNFIFFSLKSSYLAPVSPSSNFFFIHHWCCAGLFSLIYM